MLRLRLLWIRIHRWTALSIGWVLILSGLTGSLLVVSKPVERWMHPELFRASSSSGEKANAPLETILQSLRTEFGAKTTFTLRPARRADETLWVLVRGPWSGTLYLNPLTGEEQGRREETEGLVNAVFKLHSSLLMQDTGKAILAWVALVYLLLLLTGLVLWWPKRWPPSWNVELRRGVIRAAFDLHRVSGAAMGVVIAVSVASGAYMAWRPLGGVVTWLSGASPAKAPSIPKTGFVTEQAAALDEIVQRAQSEFPDTPIGYIQVPPPGERPVRIRFILADDPHPNGLTSVWMHPGSGEVVGIQRWDELDPGARAVAVVYPLHTGVLGGPALEVVITVSGLTLGILGGTGIYLWWRRRRVKSG